MKTLNYSTVRKELAETMEQVHSNHEPVIVTKKGDCSIVIISLEDYSAMAETEYLLASPANAKHLARGIAEHRSGKTKKISPKKLEELLKC